MHWRLTTWGRVKGRPEFRHCRNSGAGLAKNSGSGTGRNYVCCRNFCRNFYLKCAFFYFKLAAFLSFIFIIMSIFFKICKELHIKTHMFIVWTFKYKNFVKTLFLKTNYKQRPTWPHSPCLEIEEHTVSILSCTLVALVGLWIWCSLETVIPIIPFLALTSLVVVVHTIPGLVFPTFHLLQVATCQLRA